MSADSEEEEEEGEVQSRAPRPVAQPKGFATMSSIHKASAALAAVLQQDLLVLCLFATLLASRRIVTPAFEIYHMGIAANTALL